MSTKILHILSGDLWGGAETQVFHLLSALRNLGADAEALLFNEGPVLSRFRDAGIPSELIDEGAGSRTLFTSGLEMIRSSGAEAIVAHGYKEGLLAAYASRRSGKPWVAVFHGLTESYQGFDGMKMAAYQFCYRQSARISATRILTVSKQLAQDLGFANSPKARVFYNTSPTPSPLADPLTHPAIAVVGRLSRVKRIDIAIEAFALFSKENPEATLYIVGEGPEKETLRSLASSKPEAQIEFLGFRPDAASIVAAANALFITSDSEGIPTVLLEAASAAVPIAATEVGGIPEVFEIMPQYPKVLFPPGDPAAAAEALSKALALTPSDEQRTTLSESYRDHFAPERAAREHLQLYQELISQ